MADLERSAIKRKEVLKQRLLRDMKSAKLVLTDEAEKTLAKIKRDARKEHEKVAEKVRRHVNEVPTSILPFVPSPQPTPLRF